MDFTPKFQELQQRIPVTVDNVLAYPLPDYNTNMEDALRSSSNPNIFFTAGLSFLRRQLVRRMWRNGAGGNDRAGNVCLSDGKKSSLTATVVGFGGGKLDRKYSDLLIFELKTERTCQRFFVRVKNTEKYEEVMRREACFPARALTLDQILPTPRKMARKSLSVMGFLKVPKLSSSVMSIVQNPSPKASFSLFTLFRKSRSEGKVVGEDGLQFGPRGDAFGRWAGSKSTKQRNVINPSPINGSAVNKTKFSSTLGDFSSFTTLRGGSCCSSEESLTLRLGSENGTSDLVVRGRSSHTIETIVPVRNPSTGVELRSYRGRILTKAELEILKLIPNRRTVLVKETTRSGFIKNAERESSRTRNAGRRGRAAKQNRKTAPAAEPHVYYFNALAGGKSLTNTIATASSNFHPPSECRLGLGEHSSKLSVCISDDDDGDSPSPERNSRSSVLLRKYSCNLTDEVKSNFSAERLDSLMRSFALRDSRR